MYRKCRCEQIDLAIVEQTGEDKERILAYSCLVVFLASVKD